jgi:hypothetical protein
MNTCISFREMMNGVEVSQIGMELGEGFRCLERSSAGCAI